MAGLESILCFSILGTIGTLLAGLRMVSEYQRAVIFRLGRFQGIQGPGLFWIIPLFDTIEAKVDMRVNTFDVTPQDCITQDNVTLRVDAVTYYRVVDPVKAIVGIKNYHVATAQIAQTTLRSIIGHFTLDQILSDREKLNERLRAIIDHQTDPWGIKVTDVEIKEVLLPEAMKRSMAQQAEAERERRAKIIRASGEVEAAQQLAEAAYLLAQSPGALQLRYMDTLSEIAFEKNSTILFPMPIELFGGILPQQPK